MRWAGLLIVFAACSYADPAGDLDRANALARKGAAEEASRAYQSVIESARRSGDHKSVAVALAGLADVQLSAGKYDEASSSAGEAAKLSRETDDKRTAGRAMTIIGLAHLYKGEYDRALTALNTALSLARVSGDRDGEVVRLSNIGSIYYSQGRYSDALDRYQQGLDIVRKSSGEPWVGPRRQLMMANIAIVYQRLGQYQRALDQYTDMRNSPGALRPAEQAQLLANMGVLYRRLGDPVKALETYNAARKMYEGAKNQDGAISVLNDTGIVQAVDFYNLDAALKTFSESLVLAEQSDNRPLISQARLHRGEVYFRQGRLSDATSDWNAALDIAQSTRAQEDIWKALFGLARVQERSGNLQEAESLLHRAVNIIESLRGDLRVSMRSDFLADKRDVYDLLIERECSKPAPDVALLYRTMEMSRGRNLQDRAAVGGYKPELTSAKALLPPNTVLLEYWTAGSSAAVLWVSRTNAGVRHWRWSDDENAALNALPGELRDTSSHRWSQTASKVAERLLSGLALPADTRHLIIVPDGKLAEIPFEVLPVAEQTLAIDRFSVSYAPTAAALATVNARRVRFPWQATAEVFADPEPQSGADALEIADRDWSSLPAARLEAASVRSVLRGRSELHVGSDARRSYIEALGATSPPILHFATHALADLQDADRSYIVMASDNGRERFDYLYLKEVASLSLKANDLAVISACDSQRGRVVRGEGIQNFSRAFLLAGSKSVVTTLWSVGDRPTSEFMTRFYARLAAGDSKADALRLAKLDFRKSTTAAHPWYWAAFVLSGDGSSPIPYVVPWWTLIAAGIAAIAVVIVAMQHMAGRRRHPLATAASNVSAVP